MENRRKRTDQLSYVMLAILFTMFISVLVALIKGDVKTEYGALVGGFGTTILGMFAVAVGFLWGSSKGSQMKDEALSSKTLPPGQTPTTGEQNATTINNSISSPGTQP